LEIIPLGGLGEFGMNMMLYRWGGDCILVDAGMMFPGSEHLGVDVIVPDLRYLDECGTLHAAVLTHGHEDHIGALPFVLARHDVPAYATPFTHGLAQRRLREHRLEDSVRLRSLPEAGESVSLGPFAVETVTVAHSIPQAVMLVIRTPLGTIVHTADFKIDPNPPDGRGTDLERLAALGREGVALLLSDSTNADRPGITPGERTVGPGLDAQVAAARARVFVTTFSSHIDRIQQVIDVAERHGRHVAVVGTSMRAQIEVAESLGLLRLPPRLRRDPAAVMDLPRNESVVLVTGSQGEPMSALARIAVDAHRDVAVEAGDLVIHSARVIPGNETGIGRMFDHLFRRGADIVTAADAHVHVSGHPSREELRLLLHLLRPRHVVPIHGEYRQLLAHAKLARESGYEPSDVVLADSGDVIELDESGCRVVDRVHVGKVFIDAALEEVEPGMLEDRRRAAYDGTVVAVVAIDRDNGQLRRAPELIARGLIADDEERDTLARAGDAVRDELARLSSEERSDEGALKAHVHAALKRFFRRTYQRRPMIIPVIVEY
jgi:ribonuclease J